MKGNTTTKKKGIIMTEPLPFEPLDPWITASPFSFSQAEAHDYIGTRLGKPLNKVSTYSKFLELLEKERTPDSFLIISKEGIEAVETFRPWMNPSESFTLELNDGDGYSGLLVYKTKTVGGIEFKSSINCLLFDAPGEPIAFIANVEDFHTGSGLNQLRLQTIQTNKDGLQNLVQKSQVILNDVNGRSFLFKKNATLLSFTPTPAPVIEPPVVETPDNEGE